MALRLAGAGGDPQIACLSLVSQLSSFAGLDGSVQLFDVVHARCHR